MPIGLPGDAATLSYTLGKGVLDLAQALNRIQALNVMLNDATRFNGSAGLQAAPLSFSPADAGLAIATYADLGNLAQVAHGAAGFQVQIGGGSLGASDFFFHARLMLGAEPL